MPARYAAASGDHNPIHIDDGAARDAGLPGVVVHGMCVLAVVAGTVRRVLARGHLTRLACRFVRPVVPGENIAISVFDTDLPTWSRRKSLSAARLFSRTSRSVCAEVETVRFDNPVVLVTCDDRRVMESYRSCPRGRRAVRNSPEAAAGPTGQHHGNLLTMGPRQHLPHGRTSFSAR